MCVPCNVQRERILKHKYLRQLKENIVHFYFIPLIVNIIIKV